MRHRVKFCHVHNERTVGSIGNEPLVYSEVAVCIPNSILIIHDFRLHQRRRHVLSHKQEGMPR